MSLETYNPGEPPKRRKRPTGDAFQDLIRDNLERWATQGLGLTETCPRFVGQIGAGGKAIGRIVAKGDVDYVGDFHGQGVKFDAKSTTSLTAFDLSLIKNHQALLLQGAHGRGCLAFVLAEFSHAKPKPLYFMIPWVMLATYYDALATGAKGARKSIPYTHIDSEAPRVHRQASLLQLPEAITQARWTW